MDPPPDLSSPASQAAVQAARGGSWLRWVLVPSGLMAVLVPSALSMSRQPQVWMQVMYKVGHLRWADLHDPPLDRTCKGTTLGGRRHCAQPGRMALVSGWRSSVMGCAGIERAVAIPS